ncbi:unnamed protein product [Miscanthus lutarioriparius]|uniref:Retrovirus-related Pol polyprotein from transposon TNT 1-94-like beta-barrel domain-containing protein n=1 Tax=Miscanthus lutarioriparius TaxID=422564 RepID=A0A811Q981_9POAL|nr:unnamed protein product [Miscanthus lutarioriparius]
MASMKFDLPLLDYKTRFSLWQVKMRAILAQSSDLDEALDGFGGKGQKSWTAEEKWKDRKALSLIHLHLHNDILQEVLQKKTVAKLWLKLESICMSKDLTSKMHVKMKLFTHKLQEGGSVMNHLSIFKEIVANLVSMEMREKMKNMVQSDVSSSKGEVLQVRGRPEQRTYNNNNSRDKSKNGKGRSKSRGRDKFYRYCKKDTHVIEDCWKLQNKEKRNGTYKPKNKSDGDGKASVVSAADSSDSGDVLVVFTGCVVGRDEWILDSACSFHICSNRDWFSSYESVQSGDVVRMGDNNPREIMDIGFVQIKMHDGMIRTLKDVRHISWMARNLISLSTLDAKAYKHSGSDGVCKVENIHEPATYTEVVVSGDCEKWISAIQEEMQSLEKNGTWDVIFKRKEDLSSSEPPRFKASQQSYIKKVLHRFNMHDAKSVSTPIAPHFKLSALQCASTDEDFEYMSRVPYSSVVGSLMICHGLLSS